MAAASLVVVYAIQNPPDLHKLFVRFSQPKSFNIFRIFDEYERLHAFGSHDIYNIRVRVVSRDVLDPVKFRYPVKFYRIFTG